MSSILLCVVAGFFAQLVDGLLGMGYGVTSTSLLLSMGIPPAAASASVHAAESLAGGASAIAHIRYRNVVWSITRRLLIPGIVGAVAGAWIVTWVSPERLRWILAWYLMALGLRILLRAIRQPVTLAKPHGSRLELLGLAGGFCDAFGGGWGPIVTASLMARGDPPRTAIGSANVAEFFVTVAIVATFGARLTAIDWLPALGLAIGGILAAPVAAKLAGRIPVRPLAIAVGLLVIALSAWSLLR